MVFPFSTHNLLLRDWLSSGGLDPDHDVRIVIVPPAQMFRNLNAGTIDGFCAGEPWNSVAVREGAGWCPTWSAAMQPGHIEKVLMVTRRFAETRPDEHAALVRALAEAGAWCDEPQHREQLAGMLAAAPYLNLPTRVVTPALIGRFDSGNGRIESAPNFLVFHRGDANLPSIEKAEALQHALGAAGLLSPAAAHDSELPRRLFQPDLHREILSSHQEPHEIATRSELRGVACRPS